MSVEFITTSQLPAKEIHKRIVDSISRLMFESETEEAEAKRNQFVEGYKANMKVDNSQLAAYVIAQGKDLIAKDPNSKKIAY